KYVANGLSGRHSVWLELVKGSAGAARAPSVREGRDPEACDPTRRLVRLHPDPCPCRGRATRGRTFPKRCWNRPFRGGAGWHVRLRGAGQKVTPISYDEA